MAGLPEIPKPEQSTPVSKQDEQQLKNWFIGAIDQGTTSTRFLIFDGTGTPIASHQMEFKQMYPHSGSVPSRINLNNTRGIDVYVGG